MRVGVLMGTDPLFGGRWLESLSENLALEFVAINASFVTPSRIRQFVGMLEARDVPWILARVAKRAFKGQSPLKVARRAGIPAFLVQNVNDESFVGRIGALRPDVLISFNGVQFCCSKPQIARASTCT